LSEFRGQKESAFQFYGSWTEFAPIAFTNLFLTIVTLGIYRFWATTRERRYLWSQSQFIDERLEWTGTGKEMFIGFLMALVAFALPLVLLNFAIQSLALQGEAGWAALVTLIFYFSAFYIIGLARFRGLRYRLSRTYWHGIRGGSHDQGLRYGWSYIWKTILGGLIMGLLVPWSMIELWNDRWKKMSFGSNQIGANANLDGLIGRWLAAYAIIVLTVIALAAMIASLSTSLMSASADGLGAGIGVGLFISVIAFYLIIGLAFLAFYAKFYRNAVDGLTLHNLEFEFSAKTIDWFKLILGHIVLLIFTLGIGFIFIGYRNWKFFITHMQAYGEIDLEALTQSDTDINKYGEGLLDAFDVGAI